MESSKKNHIDCGLGAKFGPFYVQCCEKNKKQAISLGFFHISLGITLKQEAMVVKPPEWKFMAIIARNVSTKFLPNLGQKWHKN